MQALPPKHLARRGNRLGLARNPEYVFESLTALAVILVVATIFANLPDRSGSNAASRAEPAGTTGAAPAGAAATAPPGSGAYGHLVTNWSFEQDLDGWEVVGPGAADREPQGRTSGSCASVRARGPGPGKVGLRLPNAVTDARKGGRYVASVWVRSTAPGLPVTVRLVGAGEAAEASTSQSSTLPGLLWRRVFVSHTVVAGGTDLALEVTADQVPAGDSLLVDEILLRKG
jgi:hypothetical protein